jgi:hypothetical protein
VNPSLRQTPPINPMHPVNPFRRSGPAEWRDAKRPFALHVTASPQRNLDATVAPNATVLLSAPALGPVCFVYAAA